MRAATVWFLSLLLLLSPLGAQRGEKVKAEAYADFYTRGMVIVDGQRFVEGPKTKFRGNMGIGSLERIPLGSAVKAEGRRRPDGVVVAEKVEIKANAVDDLEAQILEMTNQIEQAWVNAGEMFQETSDGRRQVVGKILEKGPMVTRVREISAKLLPPYVAPGQIRVRVVDTKEWNASAMANGAIWVYSGLIRDMSEEELAIVLGHEIAHFTHEHVKRNYQKAQKSQWLGLAAAIGVAAAGGGAAGGLANLGASLGLSAMTSGYSRDFEDQADRVGLRYCYESGYDPYAGPSLWGRFRDKYGEQDKVSNFFGGSHSRPTDRIRNIEKELAVNYSGQ